MKKFYIVYMVGLKEYEMYFNTNDIDNVYNNALAECYATWGCYADIEILKIEEVKEYE